jgi:nicotinate-nucleotide pyrophosphorylase (carboxylating)
MYAAHLHCPTGPEIDDLVGRALLEDLGPGDVTSAATIPMLTPVAAVIVARQAGVLAGLPVARRVFERIDPAVDFRAQIADGECLAAGVTLARLQGEARSILAGERLALNFLQHLSAIATRTAELVRMVEGLPARIVDTRKTVPGMRVLAKYAVRVGGGHNHRFGLYDGVLIKDNHIVVAGGVRQAIERARQTAPHTLRVEVEADTLDQLSEALDAGADIILLDNMDVATLGRAVELCRGRAISEASGGVTAANLRAVAETGVDLISIGALTHSVSALDISLEIER